MKTWQKLKQHPELMKQYLVREQVIDTIRRFFKDEGFHEAQTPIMVPVPSAEPNLEVFETELRTATGKKRRAFLIMSPEYNLKKLLAAGMDRVFEITRSFRNEEEVSTGHNPEFTMLEWYRAGADYRQIMSDFEQMFLKIMAQTRKNEPETAWMYQGATYDISAPWARLSVVEAFGIYAGIDKETLLSDRLLPEVLARKGYAKDDKTTWEQAFYQIFFNEIEPRLKASRKPVIIYDYPIQQAALAKTRADEPRVAERFEVFLAGIELGNCFSELTDAGEQRQRFEKDLRERKTAGKTEYGMDEDFLEALEEGIPESAGIAVGIDRLVMLAADVGSVAETMFFPAGEMFGLDD